MALARYESVATNTSGDVVPNATVEVRRDQPGRPIVPLWADREGTVALGNPITADGEGKFGFHVTGGSYYIRVFTGPSQQPLQEYVRRYQAIGTAGERDVEDLASALEAGTATYPTLPELQAFVPLEAGIGGKVTTGEDAGFYHYDFIGEAWVFDRPLFDTLARMNVTGGDANDIDAEIATGVADSAVVMLWIEAPANNTAPVRINDIPVLTIDEEELLPGQWLAGRTYWFSDEGTFYKLRTESDVSGLVAQAEAAATAAQGAKADAELAQTGAEAARDEAAGYAAGLNIPPVGIGDAGKQLQVNAGGTGFELIEPLEVLDEDDMASDSATAVPSQQSVKAYVNASAGASATVAAAEAKTPAVAPDFIRTEGYAAAGDGGGALYKKVASEPSHAGKFSITLDDAVTVVWYEIAETVVNPKRFAGVGDGVADDRTAIASADGMGLPIELVDGTYLVNSDITISNLLIARGGVIKPANGVTVTVGKPPEGELQRIFDLSAGGSAVLSIKGAREFEFEYGDLSALVAADGVGNYIADPDVASTTGAWVRRYDYRLKAPDFGAVADSAGTTGSGADNYSAFSRMIATATARGGGELWFTPPRGGLHYRVGTNFLDIDADDIHLLGQHGASKLFFDHAAVGLQLCSTLYRNTIVIDGLELRNVATGGQIINLGAGLVKGQISRCYIRQANPAQPAIRAAHNVTASNTLWTRFEDLFVDCAPNHAASLINLSTSLGARIQSNVFDNIALHHRGSASAAHSLQITCTTGATAGNRGNELRNICGEQNTGGLMNLSGFQNGVISGVTIYDLATYTTHADMIVLSTGAGQICEGNTVMNYRRNAGTLGASLYDIKLLATNAESLFQNITTDATAASACAVNVGGQAVALLNVQGAINTGSATVIA